METTLTSKPASPLANAINEHIAFAREQLTFTESTHTYTTSNGTVVPSVTQILQYVFGSTFATQVSKQVLDFKAAIGTATHRICEIIDANKGTTAQMAAEALVEQTRAEYGHDEARELAIWIENHVMPYAIAYTKFLKASGATWFWSEEMVYREYTDNGLPGYAGRFDRIGNIIDVDTGKEMFCIADIKTSTSISPMAVYQLAAYLNAIGIGNEVDCGCIIKLDKSGMFTVIKYDIEPKHMKLFNSFAETFHAVHNT